MVLFFIKTTKDHFLYSLQAFMELQPFKHGPDVSGSIQTDTIVKLAAYTKEACFSGHAFL